MTNYDFTGKSIKCETWEQMLHLANLAEEQKAEKNNFKVSDFLNGAAFFEIYDRHQYTNLYSRSSINVKEIPYYDFIIPTETIEAIGCYVCPFHSFKGESERNYCSIEQKYEKDIPLFNTCPLLTKSITIKLKNNEPTGN